MANGLKEIRQAAGFRAAKDLAGKMGVAPSTITRYEKDPESIPMKAAIKIADELGCTIDDIVGHDNPVTADLRGDIQRRYEALPEIMQGRLRDYLDYLETRALDDEELDRLEKQDRYMRAFKYYLLAFFEEQEKRGDWSGLYVRPGIIRGQFEEYIANKFSNSDMNMIEQEEVIDGLMHAYDVFNRTR